MIKTRYCGWILAFTAFVSQNRCSYGVQAVTSKFTSGIPCAGLQDVLVQHKDVVACAGTWDGHIDKGAAHLCNDGWHICSWDDQEVLKPISWYEATHISGCYVLNAAHDGRRCTSCRDKTSKGEMAAIGADCIKMDHTQGSCLGNGRIDASMSSVPQYTPCHHGPWMTGVLCCADKVEGYGPEIILHPEPYIRVISGSNVTLPCQAKGMPEPTYQWFKNGRILASLEDNSQTRSGFLRIAAASPSDAGFYQCVAQNSYGYTGSYKTQLKVTDPNRRIGCKDPTQGKMLQSADVAVCDGKWKGHVKHASKQLCARGWRVCSVDNMHILHSVLWDEITARLPGCYAYNAATSKFFPCSKCMPKRKGNRMSGLGQGCGLVKEERYSCLPHGRIDVSHNSDSQRRGKDRESRSCSYQDGVTSGVACCQIQQSKKVTKSRRKVNCRESCDANSYCNFRGRCKCFKGFKRRAGMCVVRGYGGRASLVAKCRKISCLNGGVCRHGVCDCPQGFAGVFCEDFHNNLF